ncbi:hypothetical protein LP417_10745 [Polaromonas sp. P1-6]|nr:hypothetical protein LP417_10745 [Polaromonas sp. P1-6]
MKIAKITFAILFIQSLAAMSSAAHAQSTAGSFGVTIELRTFSEAATADHRCTHRGQAEGQSGTLRISCPATVDVQAIASASTGKPKHYMNGGTGQPDRTQLAVVAGQPMNSPDPIELTISW